MNKLKLIGEIIGGVALLWLAGLLFCIACVAHGGAGSDTLSQHYQRILIEIISWIN